MRSRLQRALRSGAAAFVAAAPFLVAPLASAADAPPHGPPAGPDAYPAWFAGGLSVPNGVVAVGYAPRYDTLESSYAEAFGDARETLARNAHTVLRIERAVQTIGTETDLGGEFVQEGGADSSDLEPVRLDSAVVGDMVLMLVATRRPVERPPAERVSLLGRTPPSLRAAGAAATGVAPYYANEHSSWREAERRARRALAFTVSSRQRALRRSGDGDEQGAAVVGAEVELLGIQVVARWRSAAGVHVMVRARAGRPLAAGDGS